MSQKRNTTFRATRRLPLIAVLAAIPVLGAAIANADSTPPPTPIIVGEAIEGETLTATDSATGIAAESHHWQRCDPSASSCESLPTSGDASAFERDGWHVIDGATGHDVESYTLTGSDVGMMVRVLAKYVAGTGSQWAASEAVGPVAAAPTPTPPPPFEVADRQLPPPVLHETANLYPEGEVFVKEEGSSGFRPLINPEQFVLGVVVNATNGTVNVVTARNDRGVLQSAEFWAGKFELDQTKGNKPITDLELRGPLAGVTGRRGATAGTAERGGGTRRLWGRGRCRCRSSGRHSSGTVRGTHWLTVDRPDGTLTKVKKGAVEVKDFAADEKVLVKAGEQYFARARRR